MIRGHKPAAHFSTGDGIIKTEGEQQQCVHCQFLWDWAPGSGARRGYCLRCDGYICGRVECDMMQKATLLQLSHLSGATDRHCIPWTDLIGRQYDAAEKDPRYEVLPSGIVIARE